MDTHLPTQPGFYWWRATASDAWRVVWVANVGPAGAPLLIGTDVEQETFINQPLETWARRGLPIGEWIGPWPKPTA